MSKCTIKVPQSTCSGPIHRVAPPSVHYVRNSNRRHRSETCSKAIISDLEKWDVPASPRSRTGSVEGKKETIYFSACLSYVNIRDASTSLTKGRRVFMLLVSDYASKGDTCCSGHVSFYHESRRVLHSVSHHKSRCVSFYHESRCISYSI
jgi:hypothetical protein